MVITSLSTEEVSQKAIQQMAAQDYKLVSRSEGMLVFEDGKDIKTWLLIVGIFFLLIGAIIYYMIATKHIITLTMSVTAEGTQVQGTTNTQKSMLVYTQFLNSL